MKKSVCVLLASAVALLGGPTLAQTQNVPPKPDVSKQVGDWLVRCYPVQSPSPCQIFELLAQKKTGNRVMSVSLAYAPKEDRYILQIAVPLGVELEKGLIIKAGEYESPKLEFRRCDRGGCYVEGVIDAAMVDALSRSGDQAKATISSAEGRSIDIAFSLKGFGDAHTQMAELARQKAVEPPKAQNQAQ